MNSFQLLLIRIVIIILPILFNANVYSQSKYWVYLTDKKEVTFNPYEYFDALAIERRIKNNISLYDSTDFPLNENYYQAVEQIADSVCGHTRWFNAMACELTYDQLIQIQQLPFVRTVEAMISETVYAYQEAPEMFNFEDDNTFKKTLHEGQKSLLEGQISWMQGQLFGEKGITGKGVRICIIDAGFPGVNTAQEFAHIRKENRIIKTWDFVKNQPSVYKFHSHGSTVLSCISGISTDNIPIGMAPDAEFLLARTERITYEGKSEEEDWLMAVEWADRNGASIINSSLGYTVSLYFKENMDGKTAIITKAANIAAKKGILVVNAAGNEGSSPWKFIAAPADADSALTVGGINPWTGIHSSFSSFGPTADFRMKPNVSAFGHVMAFGDREGLHETQGTSFASPLVVGFAACVMQMYPNLTNMQIFDLLEQSSNLYPYFDYAHGYGIPQASWFLDSTKILLPNEKDTVFSIEHNLPIQTFDVTTGKTTIDIMIREDFFQENDNVVVNYHNQIKNFWKENDFFHLVDNFISNDSKIKSNSDNFLYYHFEDASENKLTKYYIVQPSQKNVLSIPIRVNKNKILRIHFKGYTYEMIIIDVPEKEDNEEDGEGNSDEEKKEEKKELKINIEDHF